MNKKCYIYLKLIYFLNENEGLVELTTEKIGKIVGRCQELRLIDLIFIVNIMHKVYYVAMVIYYNSVLV